MSDKDNKQSVFSQLKDRHQIFVMEYIIDFNTTRACKAAGFSHNAARQVGYALRRRADISAAIDEVTAERAERLSISAEKVLSMYWSIATADYNEIVSLTHKNCRYCFGDNNEYQWTRAEYENACIKAIANQEPEPICAGGAGFNINGSPNPKCPECQGNGVENVRIADTTTLSGEANLVYQGVKEGKFGTEVMMTDRQRALDMVAKHLGMFKETVNHVSEDGSMTPAPAMDLSKLTDEELRDLSAIMAKTESTE